MRKCFYCGKWVKNKQSLRAHLRFCKEWQKRKPFVKKATKPFRKFVKPLYKFVNFWRIPTLPESLQKKS